MENHQNQDINSQACMRFYHGIKIINKLWIKKTMSLVTALKIVINSIPQ
jgi:hypothetical protein